MKEYLKYEFYLKNKQTNLELCANVSLLTTSVAVDS